MPINYQEIYTQVKEIGKGAKERRKKMREASRVFLDGTPCAVCWRVCSRKRRSCCWAGACRCNCLPEGDRAGMLMCFGRSCWVGSEEERGAEFEGTWVLKEDDW